MRMIDRIKQAMRDTGVCDGMSNEDLDIAVTAALEAMREPSDYSLARYAATTLLPKRHGARRMTD